jgi:hypothetical protein
MSEKEKTIVPTTSGKVEGCCTVEAPYEEERRAWGKIPGTERKTGGVESLP